LSERRVIHLQTWKGGAMDMDRVFSDQNIEKYRKLASGTLTTPERRKLLVMLAEEKARPFEFSGARSDNKNRSNSTRPAKQPHRSACFTSSHLHSLIVTMSQKSIVAQAAISLTITNVGHA
jgi:hypothetical protein